MNNEEKIKKGNLKVTVFDTFPLDEMIKINKAFKELGYVGNIISNGNIVFQKESEE